MPKAKTFVLRVFVFVVMHFFALSVSNAMPSKKRLKHKADKMSVKFAGKVSEDFIYRFKADSVHVSQDKKELILFMNPVFSYIPFRAENVREYKGSLKRLLGRRFRNYTIRIKSMGQDIENLIPNFYRGETAEVDVRRLSMPVKGRVPLVRRLSDGVMPEKGLKDNFIALWHSHGWYYSNTMDRWEWQRARVFTTVEDLWSMEFVVPYLAPMLENAGATVLLPRERDLQHHEVIVDGEETNFSSDYIERGEQWDYHTQSGFAMKYPFLLEGENPFEMGRSRRVEASDKESATVKYVPNIPSRGEYAVYVSYSADNENVTDAHYTVSHLGGKTQFLVNQSIGGKTWVYLGNFLFERGKNPTQGMVELTNKSSEKGSWVSADAVRFGGGMGNVARGSDDDIEMLRSVRDSLGFEVDSSLWTRYISGRPRYQEGARYYLQFAGMPDSLVYSINRGKTDYSYRGKDAAVYKKRENGKQDYKDDYMCRGEWVGYLMGAPGGPTNNPLVKGLGVPVDMALAFHTDAGITPDNSIIGTLAIYNTTRDSSFFPNGQSKWASRDLVDIVQSQVVEDIQKLYEPQWRRRGMWNKQYSEAYRPKVPTMLMELLSHQNFADMCQAMDPRFKFDVSRSMYKGVLKFLSFQYGRDYVVQPLPVNHLKLYEEGDSLLLSWKPVIDDLEPTAMPEKYKVYTRIEKNGFDNGVLVSDNEYRIPNLKTGVIYSFMVTALNEGGESFASEILAYCKAEKGSKPVLVVNAFDRVSAPASFDNGVQAGFLSWEDEGVSYKRNVAYVGDQYDFDRKSPWLDNDACGHGSCHADQEEHIVPGNSFDYPVIHGDALRDNGYGFISMSDEAFEMLNWSPSSYSALDIILGEEKTTHRLYGNKKRDFSIYTPSMREAISKYLKGESPRLIITGAYPGTDLSLCGDTVAIDFAREVLHYTFRTNHASKSGKVYHPNRLVNDFDGEYQFQTQYDPDIYKVEAPDAIEPVGVDASVFLRYKENNKSAGVVYDGDYKTIILGFPFETIQSEKDRNNLMRQMLEFFEK